MPLSPQLLAKGGAHTVRNNHPLGAHITLLGVHGVDRAITKRHGLRSTRLPHRGTSCLSLSNQRRIKRCARAGGTNRRILAIRPRGGYVPAVAMQLQPLVAIRRQHMLQAKRLQRCHSPRSQAIAAGFVAGGRRSVDKQTAQAALLGGNRRRRPSRTCTHNHDIEHHVLIVPARPCCNPTGIAWTTVVTVICPFSTCKDIIDDQRHPAVTTRRVSRRSW